MTAKQARNTAEKAVKCIYDENFFVGAIERMIHHAAKRGERCIVDPFSICPTPPEPKIIDTVKEIMEKKGFTWGSELSDLDPSDRVLVLTW